MLPSTGYFKSLGCPFLGSGLCERPHCHFRHSRSIAATSGSAPRLLHTLVTQAVQRALASPTLSTPVTEPPPSTSISTPTTTIASAPARPTYRPTPIAQLNQQQNEQPQTLLTSNAAPAPAPVYPRHIPVPYTPHRPSRLQLRRPDQPLTPSRPQLQPPLQPADYKPGCPPDRQPVHVPYSPARRNPPPSASLSYIPTSLTDIDTAPPPDNSSPYTPLGSKPTGLTYNPGIAPDSLPSAYHPVDAQYSPAKKHRKIKTHPSLQYKPTPLSNSAARFSSDEDEPPAETPKPDDEEDFMEGLDGELEMIGQILEDEKASTERKPSRSKTDRSKHHPEKRKRSSENDRSKNKHRKSSRDSKDDKKSASSKEKSSKSTSRSTSSKDGSKRDKSDSKSRSSRDRSKHSSNGKRKRDDDKKRTNEKSKSKSELNFSIEDDVLEIYTSESDEETITQECLKIFEEYTPSIKETVDVVKHDAPEVDVVGKKRVAHATDQVVQRPAAPARLPDHKAAAVRLMTDRSAKNRQFHEARVQTEPKPMPSKIRIAHVPNVNTLLTAKKALPKPSEAPKPTIAQTVAKGSSRLAHMPSDKFSDRPSVLEPLTSKVPLNIRMRYLNLMIDECLKIYLDTEDSYARALQEELATSKKCSSIPIYKNSAAMAISRLRKETPETGKAKLNNAGAVSHNKILDGKAAANTSWSIERKYKNSDSQSTEFVGEKFYKNISRWVLTEQDLTDNGFPRPHPNKEKGKAKIFTENKKQKPPRGNLRNCCRCNKEYAVDKRRFAVVKEECIYHPNRKYRFRGEVKYQCCGQDESSDGCLSAPCHVYEYIDHDNLRGYVTTLPKDPQADANTKVYALDCEMCYTTNGLDLTRVTVIDSSCKVIYESLVKPIFPIIDYNTRYSGLTEDTMKDCTTTLLEVQATFLHMFSEETILVGHSLESDFKALKLIHNKVVDTSVLFPHKMGPPYKRALRNLSSEYLKKIIQNSVDGHDSAEDAMVCMELLIWKLKEELKLR